MFCFSSLYFFLTYEKSEKPYFALSINLLFLKRATINCPFFVFVASKNPFIFRFAPEKVSQLIERQMKKKNSNEIKIRYGVSDVSGKQARRNPCGHFSMKIHNVKYEITVPLAKCLSKPNFKNLQ